MVTVITGTTHKPLASAELKSFFEMREEFSGYLYIGYPIIGTPNGAFPIDAMLISKERGLIIFNLVENKNIDNYQEEQDESYNKMEAKLKSFKELTSRRNLCVKISVVTFAPLYNGKVDEEYPICNEKNLGTILGNIEWAHGDYYEKLIAVVQAISTIRRGKRKRNPVKPDSKGAKLRYIEDSIANLDGRQSQAVIETVEGVQRIRGLAGSGKTIVLALKAAYLHAQHPEWKIAVTFNTRSLKGQLRQLINTFTIEQTGEEPNWDNLQIIHAWGAPGEEEKNGIYYNYCKLHSIDYFDYMAAKNKYGRNDPFGRVCTKALEETEEEIQVYDAVLVDEAQDLSINFLRLCYNMLKEPKRLVYAYDELQNLNSQSLPAPEKIFGLNKNREPKVKFVYDEKGESKQDIILDKCYRNSRPALVTAHALGFGIYRKEDLQTKTGLVQIFENRELWEEIGYKVKEGSLKDGEKVVLERTEESSPLFLENHSSIDDLVFFKTFKTIEEQDKWVADSIQRNLNADELRPDDIIVINPEPTSTRAKVAPIRKMLFEKGIPSHTAGVDSSPDVFFDYESIVFSGIYRAKGNEAAMVYVINAQDCYYSDEEMARVRNRLFTAITRSKAWVRVLGVGPLMKELQDEYYKVRENNFELNFTYPTEEQRKTLNIINRDMSESQKDRLKNRKQGLNDIINDLINGQVFIEDFSPEQINRLKELLNRKEDTNDHS